MRVQKTSWVWCDCSRPCCQNPAISGSTAAAEHVDGLGVIGWILPELHDPDGHEVRFYTRQHHTEPAPGAVTTINDPRESAERRERAAT
jgi:hypothetical protein